MAEESIKIFEKNVVIVNELGLHARPAAMIVKNANAFSATIYITKISDGETVNAKSIMGVMMLAASKGTKLLLRGEGDDCEEAVICLEEVIKSKFGED